MEDTLAATSLQAHYGDVGSLAPVWFTVGAQGELQSSVDPKMTAWASAHKLALMPVIVNQNFKPEIVQLSIADGTREKLIAALVKIGSDSHFAGFELDFEEVPPAARGGFTRLVSQLADALHKQKMLLGVAVPAPLTPGSPPALNPPVWTPNPRAAGFDYKELARAADSLTLMAYDEYTSVDQPGPIAGFSWVEACVRQSVRSIPPQKLLLGLALYYRHWNGTTVSEGPFPVARALAAKSDAKLSLNTAHQENTFSFSDAGVKHVVWGEDAANLATRFRLIDKYKLAGFAAWRLGQEDPDVWQKVFRQSNGKGL
jgi:spore germination protein YaaH